MARTNTTLHATAYATFFEALILGEIALKDLAEETGMHNRTVRRLINIMHGRKLIHICGWAADSRGACILPVFKLGKKKDVPRPRPRTAHQRRKAKEARENLARIQNLGVTA